jgi:hypothetical protein
MEHNGYYELTLFNNHKLQVWTAGKLCILSHPLECNENDDNCRERIIKYIHHEGLLDDVIGENVTMIDSYAKPDITEELE